MPFRETVSSCVAGKCCQSADTISEGFELGWSAASAISDTPDNEGSTAFHSVPYFVRGPIIMSHRRRGLKPDLHFLTVLEAASSRSRCQRGWFLLRPLPSVCRPCCVLWWPFFRHVPGVCPSSYKDIGPMGSRPILT